jgi:hypothetical protein
MDVKVVRWEQHSPKLVVSENRVRRLPVPNPHSQPHEIKYQATTDKASEKPSKQQIKK